MGDTSIKFEVIPGKNQKSEYVMTCGKHTVRGWCKYNLGVTLNLLFLSSCSPLLSILRVLVQPLSLLCACPGLLWYLSFD